MKWKISGVFLYFLDHSATIQLYQPLLHRIAYSIVGSVKDAEDLVQDTFLKWLSAGPGTIRNPKAYLVKAVYNNANKHLQQTRRRVDHPEDPEKLHGLAVEEDNPVEIKQKVTEAFASICIKLQPIERAVLVLRESLSMDYDQLQEIFDKSKDNLRQILSRAKSKLDNAEIPPGTVQKSIRAVQRHYEDAVHNGKISDLIEHFRQDVTQYFKK